MKSATLRPMAQAAPTRLNIPNDEVFQTIPEVPRGVQQLQQGATRGRTIRVDS
jgi:hypothetical protein